MAGKFPDSRLARQKGAGHSYARTLSRAIALMLVMGALLVWAFAQSAPAPEHQVAKPSPARSHSKKRKPEPPLIAEPAPQPPPPPTPPPKLTPEQMPPRTPEVVWDGSQLTINAENSTLSDILVGVRTLTGAAIDVPSGAASERMAARLGPAPIREVLTSLLSGTNYDYIIQASETNENEIASVILTPRGKDDALANASLSASNPNIRRGPGYTASGKHTFEVLPDENSQSSSSRDVASSGEGAQTGEPTAASGAGEASVNAQPSSADPSVQADSSSSVASTGDSSDSPRVGRGLLPGIDPSAGPPTMDQMEQGMQRMFEQRRQIQVQLNQAQSRAAQPSN